MDEWVVLLVVVLVVLVVVTVVIAVAAVAAIRTGVPKLSGVCNGRRQVSVEKDGRRTLKEAGWIESCEIEPAVGKVRDDGWSVLLVSLFGYGYY